MPRPLDDLVRRLLRHGVSPAEAARYAQELGDHREDLIAELIENGADPTTAQQTADARLGDIPTLANAAIRTHRRQSFMGRHAWFFFGIVPLLGVPFAIIIPLMVVVIFIVWMAGALGKDHVHLAASYWSLMQCAGAIEDYLWPGVVGILLYRSAWRRGLGLRWRFAICTVVALWGAWLQCTITPGDESHQGRFTLGAQLMPSITQALAAAAIMGICAWLLERRARRAQAAMPIQTEAVA